MRKLLSVLLLACSAALAAQQTVTVSVSNPSKSARADEPVVIPLGSCLSPYRDVRSALVTCRGQEIPCQLDDLNQDDAFDELCFLCDLKPLETKEYTVTLYTEGEPRPYPARVYAEMLLRNDKVKEKNKHDNFLESITARGDCADSYHTLHHHGVAFESELGGLRIYFDKRQTPDLYGKRQKRLELKDTQFYTSKQQKAEGYGDDVLWVGNTFGLGAFRGWDGRRPTMIEPVKSRTQRIVSYGPLRTIVEIYDRGWQVPSPTSHLSPLNMLVRYTQYAGHRDTEVEVVFNRPVADYLFSTGIIDVKGSEEFSDHQGLRACWGTDWPSGDTVNFKRETVGLGILIPQQYIKRELPAAEGRSAEGATKGGDLTFVVGTDYDRLHYRVVYCSDNETFGFHSAKEWFAFLEEWKRETVSKPIQVKLP